MTARVFWERLQKVPRKRKSPAVMLGFFDGRTTGLVFVGASPPVNVRLWWCSLAATLRQQAGSYKDKMAFPL